MIEKIKEKKYFYFCILAAISAAVIAVADYLLEYTGSVSEGLSIIEPAWADMASWRFPLSLNLCAFFIPFYILGFWSIRRLLAVTHPRLANAYFGLVSYGVIMGASFVHSALCYFPMIYQKLGSEGQQQLAEDVIITIEKAIMPAFVVHYILSWVIPQIILFILILRGKTIFRSWTAILNPFIFLILGIIMSISAPTALMPVYVGIINKGNTALFILAAVYEYKRASGKFPRKAV